MKVRPGTMLGQYRIDAELGRGGMATVFKGYQPSLARIVAIKVLPDFFAGDADFRERFQQEAIAVAGLRHANIPIVHDYGESDGTNYIVSEYIGGGTLTERLGQPVPIEETVGILRDIASALDYAHSKGVLHRDVKPSNILLETDGTPMLADFGLAKILGAESNRLTKTGTIVGTPEYMSPEQCEGESLTPACDLYALGVVAYEMLTGRPPFMGPTPVAVLVAQVKDTLPSPKSLNPEVTEVVERVLVRALAKAPSERHATCSEFIAALSAAMGTIEPTSAPEQIDLGARVTDRVGSEPDAEAERSQRGAGQSQLMDDLQTDDIDPQMAALGELDSQLATNAAATLGVTSSDTRVRASRTVSPEARAPNSGDARLRWRRIRRASRLRLVAVSAAILVVLIASTIGFVRLSELTNARLTAGTQSSPRPSASATSSGSPTPSSAPSPNPSPSPSPSPSRAGPSVNVSLAGGSGGYQWTMTGAHYTPGRTVTIRFYDPPNSQTYHAEWTAPVAANGTFQARGSVAWSYGAGTGRFLVCDTKNLCASTDIHIP